MNTRALNALADVIHRAYKAGRVTPMGIAQAIDAAQMLQSPETAAELTALRERVAELEAQVAELVEQRDDALVDLATTPDTYVDCRVCGAGHLAGKPCGVCEFNARMAAGSGGESQ